MRALILSLFVALITVNYVDNFIIGIDFGTEFYKIVLIKPGSPFSIVENIQSMRKTPTTLFIKDEERVYGLDAINKKIRNPQNTFVYMHDFLAKPFNNSEVKAYMERYFITYDIIEDMDRQSYEFKIKYDKKDLVLSSEEVVGMLLRYVKFLSDKYSKSNIRDCVITVPGFFGYKERLAIHQSAEIAGLTVLGIINENLGAAIQYGLEKKFNKTENIIFYNMGSSYTQASLVTYKTTEEINKATNKTFDYNTITVISETWDKNLGGRDFNYKIIRHLMTLFDNLPQRKGKPSVQNSNKIAEKMLPSAIRAKEVLSANKDAFVQVLGVEDNLNLQERFMRETFEKISEDELSRVYVPIERLLNSTKFNLDSIDQVELIGGSIRIPAVQERLKEKLGNKLGMHMNGDESVAFGTAFLAANLSSNFRTKRVDIIHGMNFEIRIKLNHYLNKNETLCEENYKDLASNCTRSLNKETALFKLRHGFDISRTVSFTHDSDFEVNIYEKFENDELENHIITLKITGVNKIFQDAIQKGIKPFNHKIHLRFKLDKNGFIDLTGEVTYDHNLYFSELIGSNGTLEYKYTSNKTIPLSQEDLDEEYFKILESLKANETSEISSFSSNNTENMTLTNQTEIVNNTETENKTDTVNTTESTVNVINSGLNITSPKKNRTLPNDTHTFKMKSKIGEVKTSEAKKRVSVHKNFSYPLPLSKKKIRDAKSKLDQLDKNDEIRVKTMERRNFLESFLYEKREWLESSNEAKKFMTAEELENCTMIVSETKDWFEEDGFAADLNLIESKIKNVTSAFTNSIIRQDKLTKLFKAFDNFENELKDTMNNATNILKHKPWINDFYNNFSLVHKNLSNWFNDIVKAQHHQGFTQEPATTPDILENKMKSFKLLYRQLNRIPMPKPEKVEVTNDTLSNQTIINETLFDQNISNQTINNETQSDLKIESGNQTGETNNTQGNTTNTTNSHDPKSEEL